MLDLSSNRLKYLVPPTTSNAALTALKLPTLLSLNISDNPIVNVRQVVNALAQLTPNLTDLQISLFTEEDVDFIIRKLTSLKYLNNIAVERNEDQFYESHEHTSSQATAALELAQFHLHTELEKEKREEFPHTHGTHVSDQNQSCAKRQSFPSDDEAPPDKSDIFTRQHIADILSVYDKIYNLHAP